MQENTIRLKYVATNVTAKILQLNNHMKEQNPKSSHTSLLGRSFPALKNYSRATADSPVFPERSKEPKTLSISDMKKILMRNRAFLSTMAPLVCAPRSRNARCQTTDVNAPMVEDDQELHAPAFWNLSAFKRSYELMEKTLQVYIYKEGEKPIFHDPMLEGSTSKFVVDDPQKAHLFYMPFSSSILRFSSYVPGPHGKRHLLQYLNNYIQNISAEYSFWNRTGGSDHFFVACHDWGPLQLGHHGGLPTRKGRVPPAGQRPRRPPPPAALAGRPAGARRFLAFYAGRMHGYLRPTLVRHWQNRDPSMKIFGRMVCGARCRKTYSRYMQSSLQPRVVEAILHGCVPVIISDHYAPPFFEVLNWGAFSVVVPEADIPRLKEILSSIPRERYLALQLAVHKVRRHFLWRRKPVKYDLFHMILHSVWFNRLNQMSSA
ncbi:unnamed protein product [Spirodela intermedia]|uniref:Exostosin GT47 domain-containing protein n=1 Tax=Spirodela intermedia TaxID=51605 RepID=A0A7I8ISI8_SPIIN|nr:unnamed protein product [Spirodela intermedia]CAA6660829.1 unnamed protein product [Spirodela intermedia]